VIELPPPRKPHGFVCSNVARLVGNYTFERGEFYVTSNDSGVILERDPDTVRGPDVALYNDANTFEGLHPKYGEVPPLLAVEVLSPDDKTMKVLRKINDYLRAGIRLVWVVDPETRTVAVYQPDKNPLTVGPEEELAGEGVLPDFRCRVADFFRLPGSSSAAPPVTPSAPPPS
jgi:Uma2 family endonuclease